MKYYPFILTLFLFVSTQNFGQELSAIISDYENYQERQENFEKTAWPDVSQNSIKEKRKVYQHFITRLEACPNDGLTIQDNINKDLLSLIFNDVIANIDHKSYLMPLSAEGGFIISMIYETRGKNLADEKDRKQYKTKIESTPRYIDQQIANLKVGLNSQITMPKIVVENCITVLDDILKEEHNFLLVPLGPEGEQLESEINKAFNKLYTFLKEEYHFKTRTDVGVVNNSNGKEYYQQRVAYFTTTDMTPQEVFEVGMSEVQRIRNEMQEIMDSLKFDGSYGAFLQFLRTDKQFYVDTPEELLRHAAYLTVKAQEILPKYFGNLPQLPLTVNPVPAAIAPNYTTGRYSGGSMKSGQAGQYWVNTHNLPARPLFVLPALTLHEGVPGHHLQISLAKELEDLPKFRKTQYLSAYGEGWGLYAEYLGKEAGIYTTLYQDFGRLTYEMWRACRLVVDPGMHYFNWSRQRAFDFMKENTALSIHEINTEINRYIG